MASNPIVDFFQQLRRLFGYCPCCDTVFRLSDCKIYHQTKPEADWKDELDKQLEKLDRMEEKIMEKIEAAREVARESGRKDAKKLIKKIDNYYCRQQILLGNSSLRVVPSERKFYLPTS